MSKKKIKNKKLDAVPKDEMLTSFDMAPVCSSEVKLDSIDAWLTTLTKPNDKFDDYVNLMSSQVYINSPPPRVHPMPIVIKKLDGLPIEITLQASEIENFSHIRKQNKATIYDARTQSITIDGPLDEEALKYSPLLDMLKNFLPTTQKETLYAVTLKSTNRDKDGTVTSSFFTTNGRQIKTAHETFIRLLPSKEEAEEIRKNNYCDVIEIKPHSDDIDGQLAKLQDRVVQFETNIKTMSKEEATGEYANIKPVAELYSRMLKEEVAKIDSILESAETELCKQLRRESK
jgi:hypothetical protein